MFGYWICMVLASVPFLPAGTFPQFQVPVMLVATLLAGALALVTVRRQRTFLLALLIPVLVLLYLVLFNLMQTPTRHADRLEPSSVAFFAG
jgi:lipopolysaccharide export LptBFGC system permease protein LptF